jgi:hypothetical protein
MSPEPYVRMQAFVLGVLLVALAVLGASTAGLACAAAVSLGVWLLARKYRSDLAASAATRVPEHRARLDQIVAADARVVLGIGLALNGFAGVFDPEVIGVSGAVRSVSLAVTVVWALVYLSSLVDWYVILPRVSGQLGARPCRARWETGWTTFPHTWREATRWWHIHRIVAAFGFTFGLSYAVALGLAGPIELQFGDRVVAAAAMGGFAAYRKAIPGAIWQAGHLQVVVGQTVSLRETRRKVLWQIGRGRIALRIPSWNREPVGARRGREYVMDVAIESVQVVLAAPREKPGALAKLGYARYPRKVRLQDVAGADPAKKDFDGCRATCSGVSWYCIENPECFRPK